MSAIDIVILIVFAAAAVFGFISGAVRQIGSFAGLVGGYIASRAFGDRVGLWLIDGRGPDEASGLSPQMAGILGAIIVFVAVFVGCFIVARLLRGFVSLTGLGMLDRAGGAAISVLKWFFAMSIVLNLWRIISPGSAIFTNSSIADGKVLEIIIAMFPWVMGITGHN
ncbi:MAG: CvpA family protein [Clostridium sp.]|nr:CvpA family protein [Clostridium sp.]